MSVAINAFDPIMPTSAAPSTHLIVMQESDWQRWPTMCSNHVSYVWKGLLSLVSGVTVDVWLELLFFMQRSRIGVDLCNTRKACPQWQVSRIPKKIKLGEINLWYCSYNTSGEIKAAVYLRDLA